MNIAPGFLLLAVALVLWARIRPERLRRTIDTALDGFSAFLTVGSAWSGAQQTRVVAALGQVVRREDGKMAQHSGSYAVVHDVVGLALLTVCAVVTLTGDVLVGAQSVCGMMGAQCRELTAVAQIDPALAFALALASSTVLWAMIAADLAGWTRWGRWPNDRRLRVLTAVMVCSGTLVLVGSAAYRVLIVRRIAAMGDAFDSAAGQIASSLTPLSLVVQVGGAVVVIATSVVAVIALAWCLEVLLGTVVLGAAAAILFAVRVMCAAGSAAATLLARLAGETIELIRRDPSPTSPTIEAPESDLATGGPRASAASKRWRIG